MSLNWRHLRGGNLETHDGEYTVTQSTVWMHSLIAQQRYDACYFNKGKPVLLGSYPLARTAIDACEAHAEDNQ